MIGTITVDGAPIRHVEGFKYLGSYVRSMGRDIDERCKVASRAYGRCLPVWKALVRMETKMRVSLSLVREDSRIANICFDLARKALTKKTKKRNPDGDDHSLVS